MYNKMFNKFSTKNTKKSFHTKKKKKLLRATQSLVVGKVLID